jgi:hypothetical protein
MITAGKISGNEEKYKLQVRQIEINGDTIQSNNNTSSACVTEFFSSYRIFYHNRPK